MKTDIHFIPSYLSLKKFLTVYKKNKYNIIFCSPNTDLKLFLSDILKNCNHEIHTLQSINLFSLDAIFWNEYIKKIEKKYLVDISELETVYFYCDEFTVNMFLLIDFFSDYTEVVFLDSEPNFEYYNKFSGKNKIKYLLTKIINLFLPIKLEFVNRQGVIYTWKWIHEYDESEINPLTWKQISNKFNFNGPTHIKNNQKRILFIYQDLSRNNNINFSKTQEKTYNLIKRFKKSGFDVFVKLHPNHSKDLKMLSDIIDDEKIIPSFIPSELLEDKYNLYLTYYSTGICPFLKKDSYSLYNYIVFDKKDEKILDFIKNNLKGIKLLKNSYILKF